MDAQIRTREFQRAPHIAIIARVGATIYTSLSLVKYCFREPFLSHFGMYWNFKRSDFECGFFLRAAKVTGDVIELQICSACVREKDADEFYLWVSDVLATAECAA